MGSLSHFLSLYPVSTALDVRCRFRAPWVLDHPGNSTGAAPYHLVVEGEAQLEMAGEPPRALQAGDIVMFPRGGAHRLHARAPGQDAAPNLPVADAGALPLVANEGEGAQARILCGAFTLGEGPGNPLLGALPELVHLRTAGREDLAMLQALLAMLRSEADSVRPGARAVVTQLASALFALLMRAWVEQNGTMPGLFALLAQARLQPAVQAMLTAPERPWQLAELAAACNLSRSAFARIFQQTANATPNDILMQTRMARAAGYLRQGRLSLGQVAELVGYQSEAAFSRVFKRAIGCSPGAYRRAGAAAPASRVA